MTFTRKKTKCNKPVKIVRRFGYIYTLTVPARGYDAEKGENMPCALGVPGYVIKSFKKFKHKL